MTNGKGLGSIVNVRVPVPLPDSSHAFARFLFFLIRNLGLVALGFAAAARPADIRVADLKARAVQTIHVIDL